MQATERLRSSAATAVRRVRHYVDERRAPDLAGRTWPDAVRVPAPLVDGLPDAELARLNELLPWNCFTVDGRGRALGRAAWAGKRVEPQVIPDPRIVRLHERVDLSDKHVLEVGCFEGVHTIALAQRAARVTALDSRVENVVKTLVRAAFHGHHPEVVVADLDDPAARLPECDVCHHVGVLYHLLDPVGHLEALAPRVRRTLWLDTHVARPEQATADYRGVKVFPYDEGGRADPFSGMHAQARWLLLDDLTSLLTSLGFTTVDVLERRDERNGLRILLAADR